ncbi:MAG: DUF302 domain-containing protein [Candidatus Krumholzibacteriia bacterium]
MNDVSYGYTRRVTGRPFPSVREAVLQALQEEGFGVLTEIDVKATLREKLGVEGREYRILGACNPPLAHRALAAEPLIGLLLPCNFVVAEDDAGGVVVAAARPAAMFQMVENPALEDLAQDVDDRIRRALDAV